MKPLTPHARKLINELADAAVEDAFKGSAHPDDRQVIEDRFAEAKERLERYISGLHRKAYPRHAGGEPAMQNLVTRTPEGAALRASLSAHFLKPPLHTDFSDLERRVMMHEGSVSGRFTSPRPNVEEVKKS